MDSKLKVDQRCIATEALRSRLVRLDYTRKMKEMFGLPEEMDTDSPTLKREAMENLIKTIIKN